MNKECIDLKERQFEKYPKQHAYVGSLKSCLMDCVEEFIDGNLSSWMTHNWRLSIKIHNVKSHFIFECQDINVGYFGTFDIHVCFGTSKSVITYLFLYSIRLYSHYKVNAGILYKKLNSIRFINFCLIAWRLWALFGFRFHDIELQPMVAKWLSSTYVGTFTRHSQANTPALIAINHDNPKYDIIIT